MNYKEAMEYITNTAKFGSNYGLSRTEKILEILGDPHKKIKCMHIAGTNGKGSTTAMINKILCETGLKVGMYTSPYLEEFEERIQINNKNISKEDLAEVVTEVAVAVDKVIKLGYEHPTEFEIITCAMFLYFYRQKVDYGVIEVGLGGRLDSTNVINPIISVITSISYDHMNILGNSLREIAQEKAGIIKNNVPVVCYPQNKEVYEVIEKKCKETNSKLITLQKNSVEFLSVEEEDNFYQNINIKTTENQYNIKLGLLGKHQVLNCGLAIKVIEEFSNLEGITIDKDIIFKALKEVKWPGRLELMGNSPKVIIDGAHNIDGILNLKESLETSFKYKRMILILGILADKQVEEMIKAIVPLAYKVIAVTPHSERAEIASELSRHIEKYNKNCEAIDNYEEAYHKALSLCDKEDMLVISGSLYMIGDMRGIIRRNKKKWGK